MNKLKKSKRDWLNPPSHYDTGAIQTKMNYTPERLNVTSRGRHVHDWFDGSMGIWDCSRKIDLSFECCLSDEREVNRRLAKLDKIADHINLMYNGLVEARALYLEENEKAKEDK
jgi:hypothetical protein